MTVAEETFVDAGEVARIFGISKDTVYRQAKTKQIPSVRFGRALRFLPSAIRAEAERKQDPWAYTPRSRQRRVA